ncbi:prepilin peptidase [Tissierella creatinophila]|uniref:Prepilin leader peptidase/N-methyltransferase n=1 Tax=Tissierella creatinophila DSM 6911 TaxID=1123403 RepID=A0A1U7M9C9_TISCR|nr:A24 family peptidase [Tissierella creatinophila]OLS03922.1 type 4 prepilin-like protein leader peptide-processing enzyme [Tissierella creatinophila DSM 6911]
MTTLILLYGLIIGSFLNVCIYRIAKGESISFPPSHCGSCNEKINWYDNIPVFSYLILRGRCRNCDSKISIQYPLIEALNAIIYIILFKSFGLSIDSLAYAFILSTLIVVFFIDLNHMIIPDKLVLTIFIFEILHKIVLYFLNRETYLKTSILGAVLAGGIFLLIVIISRGGMGDGDITLISSLGFILGVKLILLNIFLSFLIGAIVSLVLLALKIKTRKDPIPFGPFIIIAFFIVLLFGNRIIDLYMHLFI